MRYLLAVLGLLSAVSWSAAPALAQQVTWYDQCGGIDTWYPQGGYGYDHRWHEAVYPVNVLETTYYVGTAADYAACASIVAESNGRYVEHQHNTRPWDYMTPVCFLYLNAYSRVVTYVPRPLNQDTVSAYVADCYSSGGTLA